MKTTMAEVQSLTAREAVREVLAGEHADVLRQRSSAAS
jgi:hypothetical protein